jgi:hypothetical protein
MFLEIPSVIRPARSWPCYCEEPILKGCPVRVYSCMAKALQPRSNPRSRQSTCLSRSSTCRTTYFENEVTNRYNQDKQDTAST